MHKCKKSCTFAPQMTKTDLSHIWHSPSTRNVGKLLSANIIAQAIGIIIYPVLTRIYAPADFGLLNLFLSIGSILSLLATSEYQSAVLLPSQNDEAAGVARVGLRITALWMLIIAISVPFAQPIAHLFKAPILASYYLLLVPYVGIMGGWTVYNAWLTRHRAFGRISAYQLNQSATGVVTKLLFGWIGWLRSGLILSSILAPLIALVTAIGRSSELFIALWQSCKASPRELANKYRRFPLFSMPRSLVNNLSGNLPAILLTPFFGLNELGFFAMAMTLAFRPINMITASLHQVLFERVAQAVREHQSIWQKLQRSWLQLAAAVIPTMGILTFIMPWLVRVLLGSGWEETATLIRYMMPWLTCIFLIAPFAFISEVFGQQKLFLIIEIIYLALRIAAMLLGIGMKDFELAVILMSVVGTAMLLLQFGIYVYLLRRYESTRLTQAGE